MQRFSKCGSSELQSVLLSQRCPVDDPLFDRKRVGVLLIRITNIKCIPTTHPSILHRDRISYMDWRGQVEHDLMQKESETKTGIRVSCQQRQHFNIGSGLTACWYVQIESSTLQIMMWLVVHPSLVALPYSLRRGIIMGRRLPATNTVCLWWPVCWTTDPFAWYVKIEFGTIPEWWGAYLLYQAGNCCCLTPACIYYLSLSSPTICETRLPIETYSEIPVNPCMGLREIMGMLQFFMAEH